MQLYQAVLFDFDGVLADSEPVHFACWAEIVEPFGIRLDWETYRQRCVGMSDRQLVQFLAARANPPVDPKRLWDRCEQKQARFRERMLAHPAISSEAVDLIKSLSDYRLGVVSSSERSEVIPILQQAGIEGCFATIVCAEDVARHKPAPDAYLLAARLLGVQRALVVEDSEAGVASARAAGFEVLEITAAAKMPELVRRHLATNFR